MVAQRETHYYGIEENEMLFSKEWTRPSVLVSITEKVQTAGGTMYVTVSVGEHRRPMEVFIRIGKMGETEHAHLTGLGRVISYALQVGANPEGLIDSLEGITSEPVWDNGELIRSAEDGVAKVLRRVIEGHYDSSLGVISDERPAREPTPLHEPTRSRPSTAYVGDKCHACGGRAIFQEGCLTCLDCNFSKCE